MERELGNAYVAELEREMFCKEKYSQVSLAVIFTIVQYTIIGSRVFAFAIATSTVPQIPIILQKARVYIAGA